MQVVYLRKKILHDTIRQIGKLVRKLCVLSCSGMSKSLRPHALQPTMILCPWGFSKQEFRNGLPCSPPGNLPNPGIEPRSSTFQADSLPTEPPGKPKNPGLGGLSLLQGIFSTQESSRGLPHRRRILYQLSYEGSPLKMNTICIMSWWDKASPAQWT